MNILNEESIWLSFETHHPLVMGIITLKYMAQTMKRIFTLSLLPFESQVSQISFWDSHLTRFKRFTLIHSWSTGDRMPRASEPTFIHFGHIFHVRARFSNCL